MPARSSIKPKFVVPLVATTAKTRARSSEVSSSIALRNSDPSILPSQGTVLRSASITNAACATDECAPSEVTIRPLVVLVGSFRHWLRAVIKALRLPAVPPLTKTPPAPAGKPARSDSQRKASFSANTAPAASSQDVPQMLEAPTTRSNRVAASVGAAGTKEKNRGWSTEIQAGASTSVKIRSASRPPRPSLPMV